MNEKVKETNTIVSPIKWISESVGCACLLSFCFLLLLALYMWKMHPAEKVVSWGITMVYLLSAFGGGYFAGKRKKHKKFLGGLIVGSIYYAALIIFSVLLNHSVTKGGAEILPVLFFCLAGGMVGGMVA